MNRQSINAHYKNFIRKSFADLRKKEINKDKFTIISNNCWGGMIYESYNLIKQSPTVGLYILPSDYLKFVQNLKAYLSKKLEFIPPIESKNVNYIINEIGDSNVINHPIGMLGDIELYFVHYSSCTEAYQKWNRRISRIQWDKILFKFNDQNGCTDSQIKTFSSLNLKHNVCFTVRDGFTNYKDVVKINNPFKENFVDVFNEPFGKNRFFDVNKAINSL